MAHPQPRAPVRVRLPPLIATMYADIPRDQAVEAADVAGLIRALDRDWPGVWDCFCDSRPAIRRHINVFVDGRRAALADPLRPGADVFILTAISGG